MNPYILLGIFVLIVAGIFSVFFIKPLEKVNKFKVLSVILFVTYAATLGYSVIKGGMEFAIDKYFYLDEKAVFDPAMTIFMVILRTFTTMMVATSIMAPFYSIVSLKKINRYVLPIVAVLNVIFLENNLIAMFGNVDNYFENYRGFAYVGVIAILVVSAIYNLFEHFKNKEFKEDLEFNIKLYFQTLGMVFGLSVLFMQQGSIFIFFGSTLEKTKDFTSIHLFYLLLTILSIILPYILLKKRSLESRKLFFGLCALAGFFQYFYVSRNGLSGLPLHLCNTAIVMMFLSYVFKLKGVFYFSYFVNVLGAIFAIVMPNTEYHANHIRTFHFWFNHILAFALPILGVSLKVYERPNLKMMLRAIGFFTLYFVSTVVLNAFFNSNNPEIANIRGAEVDYFFTYSDFFIDKVNAFLPLKYNFIWEVNVGGYIWKFFPVYQLSIYGVFIVLMFVIWVVYDYLFQVADRHANLYLLTKLHRQELLDLKRLQNGGSIQEPLNKEDVGMVKIINFTKQYAGANKPSVEDFSLTINDGEVFGFIGHNGSGKSTTIKSMVGIQSLTSGSIIIDGYDISKQPLEAKLKIGYVSDNHAVYEKLTGREYVNYVADLYLVNQEDRDARIKKYVKMFNLEEAFDREIKGYSHGMKQKLVVIASLIHNPKIWILDEPLTGLDPTSAFQIKECMREHANNGNIVFFSSHVIEVVEKICDRICIIQRGKLVGVYNLKELSSMGLTLEQLYMTHVANANYNTDAPDATIEFEKRKNVVTE